MSTATLSKILALRDISDTEFRALVILSECAAMDWVRIEEERLAERMGCHITVANEVVSGLCRRGIIGPLAIGWYRPDEGSDRLYGIVGNLVILGGTNGL